MKAREARDRLLAQHEGLRAHLETCTRLAALTRAGEPVGEELDDALEKLRGDFVEHNATETAVIGRLLHGPSAWSSLMIDRMLEEHVAEHAAFWELLAGSRVDVVARIDDLAEELEAHMAAEERTFLSPITLHEEVLRVRTREELDE